MSLPVLNLDLSPLSKVLKQIAETDWDGIFHEAVTEGSAVLLNRLRANFLKQVAPDGTPWEPSYAAFRRSFGLGRRKGRAGGGTLFDTGTLFHSIQLYSISPLEMGIGTDVYYGKFHNEGTASLPKREFMGFADEDVDLSMKVLFRKIDEAFANISLGSLETKE